MIDLKKRSVTKSLSWRIIAIFILAVISYTAIGDYKTASLITLAYHSLQVGLFFLHERVWNMIDWGKSKGLAIQMTGMSGAGKSTLATLVKKRLRDKGFKVEVIDGDEYRTNLCSDLGFSKEDRETNIRRLGFVSKILARNNVISIIAAINPYDDVREELSKSSDSFKTVYVKCGIEKLKERDTKGLYRKALLPDGHKDKIERFTGISDPFEAPEKSDLTINTETESLEMSALKLESYILNNIGFKSSKSTLPKKYGKSFVLSSGSE